MIQGYRAPWAALTLAIVAACGTGGTDAAEETGGADGTNEPDGAVGTGGVEEPGPWALTVTGLGGTEFGAAVADLQNELAAPLDPALLGESCGFVQPSGAPEGLTLMVENGRIVRADVVSGTARTAEGAAIGDTEARIEELYPTLRRGPHKYTSGAYLVVLPNAPADTLHRYVFETDGARVTRFRAGLFPAVEYVEGCG